MPRKKEKREGKEEDGKFKRTKSSLSPSSSSGNRPCSKSKVSSASNAASEHLHDTVHKAEVHREDIRYLVHAFVVSVERHNVCFIFVASILENTHVHRS